MPTNVTPEYRKAEEAFRAARTVDEKIERLETMIALLPKHKGTDHLYADLKRRLSKLKEEQETSGRRGGGRSVEINREGAAQVILLGPPNSGKSSLLNALTNANAKVGDYPFTTQAMKPAIVPFEDVRIQLIDTPPVTADFLPVHLPGLVRHADGALLAADLGRDSLLEDMEALLAAFRERHLLFVEEQPAGEKAAGEPDTVRARVLANKADEPGAADRLELLREMFAGRLEVLPVSAASGQGIAGLPRMLFAWLRIVRVYTKAPGRKVERDRPYTVYAGQTVGDVCLRIHKDFYEKLRFARLWRGRRTADPLTVSRSEPVEDGDILELHL